MFSLKLKTDNAAFSDGNKSFEIARILRELADKIEDGQTEGNTRDINGNTTGSFKVRWFYDKLQKYKIPK